MSKDNAPDLPVSLEIKALSDRIKKDFKIGEGNTIALDKDFYQSTLPDTFTMADVQRIQAHDANLISAVGLALGDVALKHMTKNKGVDEVSLKFKAGKNEIGLNFNRMKTSPNPKGGEPLVRYGVLNAKVVVAGAKNSAGSWKQLRAHMSERGSKEIGG